MRPIATILAVMLLLVLGLSSCTGSFARSWTSQQAIDAFKAAGLEVEYTRPMEPKDYGEGPILAKEGQRFLMPSLGEDPGGVNIVWEDMGGRIMSFSNQEDLEKTIAYYQMLNMQKSMLHSVIYTKDNLLIQIRAYIPGDTARKYEAALGNLK